MLASNCEGCLNNPLTFYDLLKVGFCCLMLPTGDWEKSETLPTVITFDSAELTSVNATLLNFQTLDESNVSCS